MKNCLGGIGHFCMKNIFRISTQTLAYGNRKEDGRVPSRFVETRYFQSERVASLPRASKPQGDLRSSLLSSLPNNICQDLVNCQLFAEDSEKHGRLTGKTRISLCELSPMKILSPVRLMEKTQSSEKRERRAWSAGRGGERKHCAGEK